MAELIHALSTHYDGQYREPIKSMITTGFKKEAFAENVLGIGKHYTGPGAAVGSIVSAENNSFIILEAGFLDADQQSILLTVIEEGIFERASDPGTFHDVKNTKIVLTTNMLNQIITTLKARCEHIQINQLSSDDVIMLSQYFAFEKGKVLSDQAKKLIKNCQCPENARGIKKCIETAASKTSYWTISQKALEETLVQCTFQDTKKSSVSKLFEGNNWVELWKMQLQENKGKFSSDDIIKTYPSFTKGKLELITYPGAPYAGYGVLMHLAISYGSWANLGKLLKDNEVPKAKLTKVNSDLLRELGKDENHFKVCFLFGNKGYKQVSSSKPVKFDVSLDYNVDFILVDIKEKKIFAPKNNSLRELIDITDNIDESIKTIIYKATQTKAGRSAASSKDKSTRKK